MRQPASLRFSRLLIVTLLLLYATLFSLLIGPAARAGSDDIDREDPTEKAVDLQRAEANGNVSPDRLVVVYQQATAPTDPEREQARRVAGGKLLKANRELRRDVLRVPNGDAATVAQRVRALPGVTDAYPDRVARATLVPNDPYYADEWGLAKIQAATAWDTAQGQGVKVAVLDCGIHATHPDLAGKVTLQQNFSTSSTTDDLCNHGTHVAGTIAAVTNNGIGVAAVAPAVTLLNGKVLDDSGSGFFSDIDTAIQWAADNGAKVISMSLGADIGCPSGTQAAANYAWNKGAVVVAAAGNSGLNRASAPANCQNVIGVAATDANDVKPSWSNYGTAVDVAAPGVSILSTVNPDINGGTEYDYFSGTSMATPHAAGVLALIWSTSYGTTPTAVRDRLFTTADPISGTGSLWTYGRINAARAVAGGTTTPDFSLSVSPTSQTVVAGGTTSYTVTINRTGGFADPVTLSVSGLPNGATGGFNPTTTTGTSSTLTVTTTATTTPGSYPLTITGTGGTPTLSRTASATLVVDAPPTPDFSLSASPSSQSVTQGASASYTVTINRTGGFTGSVDLSVSGLPANTTASFSPNPAGGTSSALSITTGASTPTGSYPLTVTGTSGTLSRTTSVTLVVNSPASFSLSATPTSRTVDAGNNTSYTIGITRSGGFSGAVTLSVSGLPAGATASFSSNPTTRSSVTLRIRTRGSTPLGTYTLTITGASGGMTSTTTVTLTVVNGD